MARLESQNRAEMAYKKRNYDVKTVTFPKGALEQLKAIAEAEGESVNAYILKAIEQRSGLKLSLDGVLPWQKKEQKEQEEK